MRQLGSDHQVIGLDRNKSDFEHQGRWVKTDLMKNRRLKKLFTFIDPDIVIHSLAKVDVDECERNPESARQINQFLTQEILLAAPKKAKFVYISTDQVFSGEKPFAKESDPTLPKNIYGITKLSGESAVRKSGRPHLILRTNFFGWSSGRKKNFGEWVLKSLREKKQIRLFKDFFFTPLYVGHLAESIGVMLSRQAEGVYHVGGRDRVSKLGFGKVLARLGDMPFSRIQVARLSTNKNMAPRPKDISLNSEKAAREFGITTPSLCESLQQFFSDENRFSCAQLKKCKKPLDKLPVN